jgi:ABC-type sugar transport system substrate-binding protein
LSAIGLICVAAIALVAAGCGGDDSDGAASSDEARTIGYSNPVASEEGLRSVGYGMEQAIAALGLPWTVDELDAGLSADKQVADVDTFVSQGAAGVVTWTLDPGAADAAYERSSTGGVPVVGVNSDSQFFASQVMAFTDTTCNVADEQAALIAELAPGGDVLSIGGPPVPSITLTTECWLAAAEAQGLNVLEHQDNLMGNEAGGQEIMQAYLLQYPEFDALWSFSDSTTLGAIAEMNAGGVEIRGLDEDAGVVVVSRNGVQAAVDAIAAGEMTATWDNNQPLVGAAALQVLKYHYVDGVALADLPTRVNIPSKRWDSDTIGDYAGPLERNVPLPLPESCPDGGCPETIDSTVTG